MRWLILFCFVLLSCAKTTDKFVQRDMTPPPKKKNQSVKENITLPQVDILVVVDDSGSMSGHQARLANNVDLFVDGIMKNPILDYRIGVLNSTTERCISRRGCSGQLDSQIVDRHTLNGSFLLKLYLQPGTDGDMIEKFFDPVYLALTHPLLNDHVYGSKDFYRTSAHLAVIFVTDAEEQSRMTSQEFYRFLLGLKNNDSNKIHTYGAIVPSNVANCDRDSAMPVKFEELFNLSKGKYFSLCDPDFGTRLSELQKDLSQHISRYVKLERIPKPKTIEVRYGSMIIPNDAQKGWLYDPQKNSLYFAEGMTLEEQPPGTQVEVFFEPEL